MAVYLIEGTLFFGAINELDRQLQEEEARPTRVVVLQLTRVFWIDASGAHALDQFVERCHARGTPLVLVTNDTVRTILQRTGVLDHLGEGFEAPTLQLGLRYARALLRGMPCPQCPENTPACQGPENIWPGDPLPPGEGYGTRASSSSQT